MQFGSSPPSYPTSIPIEPTIPREWLENPRLEPKREKRGWLDARYEKFQKVGSGKKAGDGKGIRVGIRIAREAKLVGGNLSRGAVRIHLNPPLPSRDSSFESLAEKDLVSAVGEKRLKGESARRSAEIGSFYYRSMPALLSRHGLNKVNRLKADDAPLRAISVRSRDPPTFLSFDSSWTTASKCSRDEVSRKGEDEETRGAERNSDAYSIKVNTYLISVSSSPPFCYNLDDTKTKN